MASRSIRRILGWGNLSVPCQAPADCCQEGAETVHGRFFSMEVSSDMGEQAAITGGFSHG